MERLSMDDQPPVPLLSDTPYTAITSAFPSPDLSTSANSIKELLPTDEYSNHDHPFTHAHNISTEDVRLDPILNKLAKGQGLIPTSPEVAMKERTAFKARPAPSNMMDRGVGPRMSKAAALRMGLEWDEKKTGGERRAVEFGSTPGHKRNNLSLDIASLSRPTLAPRQNRTSQLRSGETATAVAGPIRHTAEEVSASIKLKSQEDKARRRQSMTLPPSLSAPSITPRMNRSSVLRSGGSSKLPPTSFDRYLTSTSASNVPQTPKAKETAPPKPKTPTTSTFEPKPVEKEVKRKSIMGTIRSLGAPSITPRLNKTALLRTPQSASTSSISGLTSGRDRADPPVASRPAPSSYRQGIDVSRTPTASLSRTSSVKGTARPTPALATNGAPVTVAGATAGPRPTRASLLRAGLGAKVQTGR